MHTKFSIPKNQRPITTATTKTKNNQTENGQRFAAIWMDLEIIILSEVSQTKTNIIWYHLYVESKI